MKRIALIAAVGLASLATLPYSLPVLVVAAVVVHCRRQRNVVPRSVLFRQELDALEARLREEVRETETLAKIRYTKWKLDREAEKRHYIAHGVHFPRTRWQDEQDRFFAELEKRMATEQQRFAEDARRIEHAERLKIEDQRRQAGAAETAKLAEQQRQLEEARLAAEREAADKIAAALRADLA